MQLPSVPRTIVIVAAILLLGLGGILVAFGSEAVAWSRVMRTKFEQSGGPTQTSVPSLAGAALVTVAYVQARLGR